MPDDTSGPSERRLESPVWAALVEYFPYVIYRGRVCWHHQSDAMDVARRWASYRRARTRVAATQVPGWDHPLWRVIP